MFFKPNFCCNCGEKIQRAEWKILTSRRFCDVCEVEYKGHEWFPRVVVLSGILVGLFGAVNIFRSADQAQMVPLKQLRTGEPIQNMTVSAKPSPGIKEPEQNLQSENKNPAVAVERPARPEQTASANEPRLHAKTASDEPVYFCNAMTKKGKPCSRRVKIKNGRCWQHEGQPSALVSQSARDVY